MSVADPVEEPAPGEVEVSSTELVAAPLVSVLMITYNHAPYLAEAIEGVVSQICDFPIELLIGEDASTDETRSIALEFQRRYPQTIRVIHSAANVGMIANSRRLFARSRGEFIAYCEGDDYWCAKNKLSLQAQLLRENPDAAVVHSDWVRSKRVGQEWTVARNKPMHARIPLWRLEGDLFRLFHYPKILRTCTALHRRSSIAEFLSSALARKRYRFGDTVRSAYQTSRWPVAYLPAVTAVYRESPGSALRSGRLARLAFLISCLEFDTDARVFFAGRSDYPDVYRWEVSVGLLSKSIVAGRLRTALFALRDLCAHFGPFAFLKAGAQALAMRIPTISRQRRVVS